MPTEQKAPLRDRHLEALRAIAPNRAGPRDQTYPSVMPVLREFGYVEDRPPRSRTTRYAWHRTSTGRELLSALGIRENAEI